jgi:hypothetical protein
MVIHAYNPINLGSGIGVQEITVQGQPWQMLERPQFNKKLGAVACAGHPKYAGGIVGGLKSEAYPWDKHKTLPKN